MEMGALLISLITKLFTFVSWPPFTLLCPLYASFRAVESNSIPKEQQCLTFWVLFALLTFLELTLRWLFLWFPFWPYMKGILIFSLVIPYFGGASYVYVNFVRPYLLEKSSMWDFLDYMTSSRPDNPMDADEMRVAEDEVGKPIIYQETFQSAHAFIKEEQSCLASPTKVRKDWSCPLCMVSTSSEKCLEQHFHGRKHQANEEKLKIEEDFNLTARMSDGIDFLGNFVDLDVWRGFLNPVGTSIRCCRWEKPKFGWTKLNTDGSKDRENARLGGLLRDFKGKPLCAFVCKAPRNSIFLVELFAIWRGLVLALSLGIKAVWVESDALSVVKTINRQQSYSGTGDDCLRCIWQLLTKFEEHQVSHSFRETNKAADHLAKMIFKKSDVVLWPEDFPNSLCNIIEDDAQGRLYHRKIRIRLPWRCSLY